jgi:hypothetical protein
LWPTLLKDDDAAPTLLQLLASDDRLLAGEAAYLAAAAARLKDAGHQPEGVQQPLVGNGVRLTVPLVLADRHGSKAVAFTESEPWTPERIAALQAWILGVRRAGVPAYIPVLVVSSHESPDVTRLPGVTQFIPLSSSPSPSRDVPRAEQTAAARSEDEQIIPSPETAAQMAQEAAVYVERKLGVPLPWTPVSPPAIDAIVDKIKETGATEQQAAGLLFALGCFVGEVFVRNAGGIWRRTEDLGMSKMCSFPIVVELPSVGGCNPIGKVFKRFRNGAGDSVAHFYQATLRLGT